MSDFCPTENKPNNLFCLKKTTGKNNTGIALGPKRDRREHSCARWVQKNARNNSLLVQGHCTIDGPFTIHREQVCETSLRLAQEVVLHTTDPYSESGDCLRSSAMTLCDGPMEERLVKKLFVGSKFECVLTVPFWSISINS